MNTATLLVTAQTASTVVLRTNICTHARIYMLNPELLTSYTVVTVSACHFHVLAIKYNHMRSIWRRILKQHTKHNHIPAHTVTHSNTHTAESITFLWGIDSIHCLTVTPDVKISTYQRESSVILLLLPHYVSWLQGKLEPIPAVTSGRLSITDGNKWPLTISFRSHGGRTYRKHVNS